MKTSNGQAYVCFIVIQNKKFKFVVKNSEDFHYKVFKSERFTPNVNYVTNKLTKKVCKSHSLYYTTNYTGKRNTYNMVLDQKN